MYCVNVSELSNMAYNILETILVPFWPDIFRRYVKRGRKYMLP